MTDIRTSHPFHMYDSLRQQPDRVAGVLRERRALIEEAAAAAAARKRIILAGIGTSFHAAHFGEQCLRMLSAGQIHAGVEQSFELVHYPLALGPDDAVILVSHRGMRNYSVEALFRAKQSGALAIAVTGELGGEGMGGADFLIKTCEQEVSNAHTKSFTTAMVALALLALHVVRRRKLTGNFSEHASALDLIPAAMRRALECENEVARIAKDVAPRQRIIFTGAGPNWVTAREGALKVKETSFIASEGFETEQFLHGPNLEVDERGVMVSVLTGGPGDPRMHSLLRTVGEIGLLRVAVALEGFEDQPPAEHVVRVPRVPEWLSPFVALIPIQWLSYWVAVERGTNPDNERKENPAHARSREFFRL
jgi:glucosamine--fructose-6-phosphate aminotransferase (isomerizing)